MYRDMERVYLVTLAKDTESPVGPRSDEVGKRPKKKEKEKEKEEETKAEEKKAADSEKKTGVTELKPKKPVVVKVDTDAIHDRIVALEIVPGNYRDIRMVDDRIFYLRRTLADEKDEDEEEEDGQGKDKKSHLCFYSLEDRKETVLGEVNAYEITEDGKTMLVKIKKDYATSSRRRTTSLNSPVSTCS